MDLVEQHGVLTQRHPWETARYRFLKGLLYRYAVLPDVGSILDIGAGDGWLGGQLIREIGRNPELVCWEPGLSAAPLQEPVEGGIRTQWVSQRPAGTFQLILILDVLEHIAEEEEFLKETVAVNAAVGSYVLVTVPCWPMLFGAHDVHLKHFRRYRPAAAAQLLKKAGLPCLRSGSFFHGPLLIRGMQILLERMGWKNRAPKDLGQWNHGGAVTRFAETALRWDNWFSAHMARAGWTPPGLSWWALCQKR